MLQTNFGRVEYIMDWFGQNQDDIIPAVGAGHWNDPDQVLRLKLCYRDFMFFCLFWGGKYPSLCKVKCSRNYHVLF